MEQVYIVAGARTPFGTFGGTLRGITAIDLAVIAAKEAISRSGVPVDRFDHTVFGNVSQTSADAIYGARHVGLKAGLPIEVPAVTVNRICGSGFEAIIEGVRQIRLGESKVVLAGGMENMSQAPHVIRGARWGELRLGSGQLEDQLWEALKDPYVDLTMSLTAENLAEKYNISREDCDIFALASQNRTEDAIKSGRLKDEITPVEIQSRKGVTVFDTDEHPRLGTTMENLQKLRAVFKKDGTITAGNASGISDGAAALVLATESVVKELNLKPLARIVDYGIAACDPKIMGWGPVPAINKVWSKTGLGRNDMSLVEINEAFAPQYIACERGLELDREICNVNGGAIAIGHPLGATGARLTLTLGYELKRRSSKYGVASACIGGGQGAAVLLESVL